MADTLSERLLKLAERIVYDLFRDERELLAEAAAELDRREARLTALEQALLELGDEKFRESLHMTYNGGWHHSEDGIKAFHHGMDTVCNVIASGVKHQIAAALKG